MTEQEQAVVEAVRRGLVRPEDAAAMLPPAPTASQPSSWSGNPLVQGAADLWMGLRSIPDAGAQLVTRGLEAVAPAGSGFEKWAQEQRQGVEAVNKAAQDAYQAYNPQGRPIGSAINRAAGASLAMGPALSGVAAAPTMGGRALQGVGTGLLQGAMTPVDDPGPDFWQQKLKQEAMGGLIGGLASPAVDAVARVISPRVSASVQRLMDEGVTPLPGQAAGGAWKATEEKATSIPILGDMIKAGQRGAIEDFNRAAYRRALEPLGQGDLATQLPVGRDGVRALGDYLSNAYEDALARSAPSVVPIPFRSAMANLQSMVPQALQNDFTATLNANVFGRLTPAGTITPSVAKAADSELGRLARNYASSGIASERELGLAYREAQSELRDLVAANNPETGPLIQRINAGWADLVSIENAAAMQGAKDGIFTPAQYANAVKRSDTSVRHRGYARGVARNQQFSDDAQSVLSNTYPDSGTTGRSIVGALAGGAAGGAFAPTTTAATLAALLAASAPYTRTGTQLATGLLTQRPDWARTLGTQLTQAAPYLPAPAVSGLLMNR